MESSTVHRAYRFRLEPTAEQEHRFRQFAGARRWVWNWALQQRQAGFRIPQRVHVIAGRVQVPKVGRVREGRWFGVHMVVVDRFYPSTQLCHVGGYKNAALTLADRTWQCPLCSTVHDRDINAALNIKNEGLRLLAVRHTAIAKRLRLRRGG